MGRRNSIEEGPWMDGYLKSNLSTLKNSAIKGKFDNFIIVSGMVGTGKSTIASQIAWNFNPEDTINRGRDIFYFDMQELSTDLQKLPSNSVFIIDEGGDTFMSADTRRFLNNSFYKLLLKVRAKKHLIILIIPDFFDLRAGLATRRAFALINCRLIPDESQNMFKNGVYDFYDMDKMAQLYWKGKREHNYRIVQPNFWAGFGPWFPCNYDDYENKKFNSLLINLQEQETPAIIRIRRQIIEERKKLIQLCLSKGITQQEIGDSIGKSRQIIPYTVSSPRKKRF